MELDSCQPSGDFPIGLRSYLPGVLRTNMGTTYITKGLAYLRRVSPLYIIQWKEVESTMRENWIYRRGDIYFANLGYKRGSEQCGKRPVVVLQNNIGNKHAPTLTVAPITSILKKPHLPTHFVFYPKAPMKRPSMVMAEQTQTIDKKRIVSYAGKMDESQMQGVDHAVKVHFGFVPR